VLPEALGRLTRAVLLATVAAVFGGIGTVMVIQAFGGDDVLLYAALAALTLGIAAVAALGAIIAAAGGDKGSTDGVQ
jgi:hypothetical protein